MNPYNFVICFIHFSVSIVWHCNTILGCCDSNYYYYWKHCFQVKIKNSLQIASENDQEISQLQKQNNTLLHCAEES